MLSLDELTVSATARSRGLSNQPATEAHRNNMLLLAEFLGRLPFAFTLNSAYRSPVVNDAVGGSKSSQHMQGLAADITPIGITNKEAATLLWQNQLSFPELDQVIWYTDTSHVHVGICPPGAVGCVGGAPRLAFYTAKKEGSNYIRWQPEGASILPVIQTYAQMHPLRTMALVVAGLTTVLGTAVFALWVKKKKAKKKR